MEIIKETYVKKVPNHEKFAKVKWHESTHQDGMLSLSKCNHECDYTAQHRRQGSH